MIRRSEMTSEREQKLVKDLERERKEMRERNGVVEREMGDLNEMVRQLRDEKEEMTSLINQRWEEEGRSWKIEKKSLQDEVGRTRREKEVEGDRLRSENMRLEGDMRRLGEEGRNMINSLKQDLDHERRAKSTINNKFQVGKMIDKI